MPMRRWLTTSALVLLVLTTAGCAAGPTTPRVVDRSTPESTVRAYLDAIVNGDEATASSLLAPHALAAGFNAPWREDPPPISDVRIGTPRPVIGSRPEAEEAYPAILEVPVTFLLDDYSGKDGFGGGHTSWGYRVVRNGATGPWMVSSHGV